MFRKTKTYSNYKRDGVTIRPASLDEEYEVGGWLSSYSGIKIAYENKEYKSKYSDITYVMILNKEIVGYFMAYSEINVGNKSYCPMYAKGLILYDFAIDVEEYNRYFKILFDYIINYANYNGYSIISYKKIEECNQFTEEIKKYYDVNESTNDIYLKIDNPRISSCQRYLSIYEHDKVNIEELYFLYDLNFDILKTKCRLKLNENKQIIIDRKNALITFPKNVEIIKDKVLLNTYTKNLIFLIVQMHDMNDIKNIKIGYDINNPNYYEAIIDEVLYVSKKLSDIRKDELYTNELINRGYQKIVPNYLKYDMNERSFSDSKVVYKLVK